MTYHIIQILKVIVIALNRKNLLNGKENNDITERFESLKIIRKEQKEGAKQISKNLKSVSKRMDKRITRLKELKNKFKNIDSADK